MEQNTEVNEIIQRELEQILTQLSFKRMKEIINGFPLGKKKSLLRGGVRVSEKNRKIIIKLMGKKCLEDEDVLYSVFSTWFNDNENYFQCLEPFFKSEEHKELLVKRGVEEWNYVINEAYFEDFIDVVAPVDVDKFLLLSPIYFTDEQVQRLIEISDKDMGLDDLSQNSGECDGTERNTAEGLSKGQLKYWEKQLKKLQDQVEKLEGKNEKLLNKQKKHNEEKSKLRQLINASQNSQEEMEKILMDQQKDFEHEVLKLKNNETSLTAQLRDKENRIRNLTESLERTRKENEKYFHQILSKLDTENLISSLNAPNDVLELLGNIVRPPSMDDSTGRLGGGITLKDFWHQLSARELVLIREVLEVSAGAVASAHYLNNWPDIMDDFEDLKCSLSARVYLTDMLFQILKQYS